MIKRLVLVKTDRPTRVDVELARLSALRGSVPCLLDIEVAADIGGRSRGYDRMFALTFGRAADVAAWRDEPVHAPLRDVLLSDAELLVFEYEADPRAGARRISTSDIDRLST